MIHVGIDLHSRNMTLVAINDNVKLLAQEKMNSTPANLSQFFRQFNENVTSMVGKLRALDIVLFKDVIPQLISNSSLLMADLLYYYESKRLTAIQLLFHY